jgi:hypothetical protein
MILGENAAARNRNAKVVRINAKTLKNCNDMENKNGMIWRIMY